MKVLVACEYSGIVRDAFIRAGHDAMSCDLLPSESDLGPHYQGDVRDILEDGWDLMIAHPPCTYLTIAGASKRKERQKEMLEAITFFAILQRAPIPRIAIENPTPFKEVMEFVGRYHQRVNPFEFGDPYRKKICLWLKNLPPLFATEIVEVSASGYCIRKTGPRAGKKYNYYYHQGKSAKERARFFPGVAKAMAEQWGELEKCDCQKPWGDTALVSMECPVHNDTPMVYE